MTAAQDALDGITLKAPIDGKITFLAAFVGTIVDTSTFLTISDVSHPTVTVSVDETDMDKLVVGNAAQVTFAALPGKTFNGKVSVANPQMNSYGQFKAATGQVELDQDASRQEVAQTLAAVPLGLSATITITSQSATNVLLVPVTALKSLSNGNYIVMLVGGDGKATQQTVSVGLQDKTNAQITGGLEEGSVVRILTTAGSSSPASGNGQGRQFLNGGMFPGQ